MPADVTSLLLTSDAPPASDALVPHIYDELRRIARRHLRGEQRGHTLTTTALVHEAYLRLVHAPAVPEASRTRFLAAASTAMRRILIDYARARRAAKRGGGANPVTLDEALHVSDDSAEGLLTLDEALTRLGAMAPRLAQVVECRFFGGMSEDETAVALGTSPRTVRRDWMKAKGWLAAELSLPNA